MAHFFSLENLNSFLASYGYLTVFVGLLLESAGLPLPGETLLLSASAFAARQPNLHIYWIGPIAILAASTGDNAAYWMGRRGGRPLLHRYGQAFRIGPGTIQRGEDFMRKHGPLAVFFARFIAGLRVVNGLLAGSLEMEWSRFFFFNLLGAICWVSVICSVGFLFGDRLPWIIHVVGRTGLLFLCVIGVVLIAYWFVRKLKTSKAAS